MEDSGRRTAGLAPTQSGPTQPTPAAPAGTPPSGGGSGPRLIVDDSGLLAGMVLGKYQIVQQLGSGGMGSVYEAVHRDINKPVALKTLSARLASEPAAQARFLREAATASRLTHPHVVDVTDFGADGGITFLVMELLRGEDLAGALAREPGGLSTERIADIMLAVCAGVFAAHEAGVIHRDLKPPNIFLSHTSLDDSVPKVLDFGISKLLDENMSTTLTGTGTVLGTTPYLSPEQVSGKNVDARSDQYSLGVILYECATGRRPHEGETLFAIMRSIADGRFHRPRELRPDIPPTFEAVIMRAMSQDPARRFESVFTLAQALLPFASQRRQVLWSNYYGVKAGAPLPHTQPLPELRDAPVAMMAEPLDSTRTGNRHPRNPHHSPLLTDAGYPQAPLVREKSRAPLVFVILLVAAGLGFGAYYFTRQPPQVLQVERPLPPPPPAARIVEPEPVAPPPAKVEAPVPAAPTRPAVVRRVPRPRPARPQPAHPPVREEDGPLAPRTQAPSGAYTPPILP
jgi:serine/threonine protein kinase